MTTTVPRVKELVTWILVANASLEFSINETLNDCINLPILLHFETNTTFAHSTEKMNATPSMKISAATRIAILWRRFDASKCTVHCATRPR